MWHTSSAAFKATTSNPGNVWATGTVAISDDDSPTDTAMFSASGLKPGDTGSKCIAVTYNGSLAASVKLYSSSVSGSLTPYVNLVIEQGTGGSYSSCTGFTSASTLYTGTLSSFGTSNSAFGSGVGSFSPTGSGQSKVYKFTYTIDAATPDSVQGTTANGTFVWEARNT